MIKKFIRQFYDPQGTSVKLAGGKGANLAYLTQHNFPVPPGFIVTSQAYLSWFNSSNLQDLQLNLDLEMDRTVLAQACKSFREDLARIDLPEEICLEIKEALVGFPGTAFSVRSSSTLEDMDTAVFAGQHDTYLNVKAEEVIEQVKSCFISLWEERVVLYRLKQGFSLGEAAMAVVVQQMVESQVSGVTFSINHVSGNMEQLLIDANFGLGESVVAGDVSVDHYVVDKNSLEVTEKRIGKKEFKIVSGKVGTIKVDLVGEDKSCLSDEYLFKLGKEVLRIEELYRFPQDIEWAFAAGKLFILQSRPITTIPAHWTRDESGERFPNVMTPLQWEFSEFGFHESLKFSLRLMGFPAFPGKWFAMFDNYIYGNQNAVRLFLNNRIIPFRTVQELRNFIPQAREKFGWVLELPACWTRDLDRYLINIGKMLDQNLENKFLLDLWAGYT